MKIGLVAYGALDQVSGGYRYDRALVERLRAFGDLVEVVSIPMRPRFFRLADSFSPRLRRRIDGLSVDVLLEDELCHPSLARINRRLSRRPRMPVVSIVHHLRASEARSIAGIEGFYLKSVDAFVFASDATRRSVEAVVGAARSIVARPAREGSDPGIEEAGIRLRAGEPGPLRVLFVGNIIARKGLGDLIRALDAGPPDLWTLTVVGGGGGEPRYEASVRSLAGHRASPGRVRFLGRIGDAELAAEFRRHHLLAVPSRYEGFGLAYLEGMAFGLPAIAGDAGGASEIVSHGENGFLVRAGDAAAIGARIRALAENRAVLVRMGIAARSRFLAHPRWDDAMADIRAFLVDLVRERRGSAA